MAEAGKLESTTTPLVSELRQLISNSRERVAIAVNAEITLLYWNIGKHIHQFLLSDGRTGYGKQILPTLSAKLSWSHFVELLV